MSITFKKYEAVKLECENHIRRLNHALSRTNKLFPLNVHAFEKLTEDEVAFIDQLVFRFSKLQDSMGHKLMTSGLILLGESAETLTMIDKLNLLEKLNLIEDKQRWLELSELRNQIAHEYPEEQHIQIEAVNLLFEAAPYLIHVYRQFIQFIDAKIH